MGSNKTLIKTDTLAFGFGVILLDLDSPASSHYS